MSNNNNQKPAMMAVVSAAQKKSVNINNALTKPNIPNQSAVAKKSLIQNAPKSQENPLVPPLNDSQKSTSSVTKEAIKTVIDTAFQHQNEIIANVQKEQNINNSILISDTKPTETHNNQTKNQTENQVKDIDFNNHIVSLLCDGIRNVQNQTSNFTQKLSQSRAIKKQSLTDMQKIACDNFNVLSHTYINATQKSLGTINPIDLLKNQTQCITQFHNVCANMVSTMSQTSFDIIKQNCNFNWFYNSTNQK